MEIASGLLHGFAVALAPANIFWCFVGCFLGTVVGILPGLGPAATIAMLLPLTYNMDPAGGIIMLAGIYYGAKYGGSTTSILLNMPGESSSVVTCIDGYQMARKGRAGAGARHRGDRLVHRRHLRRDRAEPDRAAGRRLRAVVLLAGIFRADVPRPLAGGAARRAPSLIKALLSMLLGLWLTSIGTDLFTAQARFIFGQSDAARRHRLHAGGDRRLRDRRGALQHRGRRGGAGAAGAERLAQPAAEPGGAQGLPLRLLQRLGDRLPARLLPGAGATIASFISYGIEKAVSRHPEKFGTGAPEGVAAPEGANNADTGGALVPLLTLGIPGGSLDRDPALGADPVGRAGRGR